MVSLMSERQLGTCNGSLRIIVIVIFYFLVLYALFLEYSSTG